MKKLILAAGLALIAAPAFAHIADKQAGNDTTPNSQTDTLADSDHDRYDRYADRDYDRDYYGHQDFWRDRATPSAEERRDRTNAERAWDGLPHYY